MSLRWSRTWLGRIATVALVLLAAGARPCLAQYRAARSLDYGFVATAQDVRALWVNPAGLSTIIEASVMGELSLERPLGRDLRIGQLSAGFNSRGLSFLYQRDRFPEDSISGSTFRVGVGYALARFTIGAAAALYRGGVSQTGVDIGLRFPRYGPVALAAVVRNIGRPFVRDSLLRLQGVAGASWRGMQGVVELAGEARATERATSGYNVGFAVGAKVQTRGRLPLGVLGALDLGNNFRIDRWSVGLIIGGPNRGVITGTVYPTPGSAHLQTISLTGLAVRVYEEQQMRRAGY